jgi:hypothetical protein
MVNSPSYIRCCQSMYSSSGQIISWLDIGDPSIGIKKLDRTMNSAIDYWLINHFTDHGPVALET